MVNQTALLGAIIQIQGLDTNWDLIVQDVLLDATDTTTLVALTTPLRRIFRVKVNAATTSTSDIKVTNAADTIDYAIVTNGNNQTLMAQFTIPQNMSGYMTGLFFSNIDATNKTPTSVEIKMWAADNINGYAFQLKHADAMPRSASGRQHFFKPYYKFSEKTDIKMTAQPADEDGHVHAGFDLILVDN